MLDEKKRISSEWGLLIAGKPKWSTISSLSVLTWGPSGPAGLFHLISYRQRRRLWCTTQLVGSRTVGVYTQFWFGMRGHILHQHHSFSFAHGCSAWALTGSVSVSLSLLPFLSLSSLLLLFYSSIFVCSHRYSYIAHKLIKMSSYSSVSTVIRLNKHDLTPFFLI